jgi:hypothetical protein
MGNYLFYHFIAHQKNENFFGSDFEFCTISLLVMVQSSSSIEQNSQNLTLLFLLFLNLLGWVGGWHGLKYWGELHNFNFNINHFGVAQNPIATIIPFGKVSKTHKSSKGKVSLYFLS